MGPGPPMVKCRVPMVGMVPEAKTAGVASAASVIGRPPGLAGSPNVSPARELCNVFRSGSAILQAVGNGILTGDSATRSLIIRAGERHEPDNDAGCERVRAALAGNGVTGGPAHGSATVRDRQL